jgi:hypothetical protein
MDLVTKTVVDGPEAEACWSFYDRAFEGLRTRAAQRHALTRAEFDDQMSDERVVKYLVYNPDNISKPVGMATMTNDLQAVPLISPEFYQARWPQFYAQQQIWYIGFLAIDADYHGTGVLAQMIGALTTIVPDQGGIMCVDICSFNEEELKLPETILRLARTFSRHLERHRLDAQVFWGYEFASSV